MAASESQPPEGLAFPPAADHRRFHRRFLLPQSGVGDRNRWPHPYQTRNRRPRTHKSPHRPGLNNHSLHKQTSDEPHGSGSANHSGITRIKTPFPLILNVCILRVGLPLTTRSCSLEADQPRDAWISEPPG